MVDVVTQGEFLAFRQDIDDVLQGVRQEIKYTNQHIAELEEKLQGPGVPEEMGTDWESMCRRAWDMIDNLEETLNRRNDELDRAIDQRVDALELVQERDRELATREQNIDILYAQIRGLREELGASKADPKEVPELPTEEGSRIMITEFCGSPMSEWVKLVLIDGQWQISDDEPRRARLPDGTSFAEDDEITGWEHA